MQFSNYTPLQITSENIESIQRLSNVVQQIYNLPDLCMERRGVLLDYDTNDDFSKTIKYIKKHYRAVGDWLKYYLLNNSELIFELSKTDKTYYQPMARKSVEIYTLAQHTYALSDKFQYLGRTPDWWLLVIELEGCEQGFRDIGLTGRPTLKGKKQTYKETLEKSKKFQDIEKIVNKCVEDDDWIIPQTPSQELVGTAQMIASKRENIAFRQIYRKF